MVYNLKIIYKYNSYIAKKILYRRIPNGKKIVELSKQPLSIAYRGKEKNALLAKTKKINIT